MLSKILAGASSAILLFLSTTLSAAADESATDGDRGGTLVARLNPDIDREVLDSLPESVLNTPIWVDPELTANTPYLLADSQGNLSVAPGQSAAQSKAAKRVLTANASATDLETLAGCFTRTVVPAFARDLVRQSVCPAIIGTSPDTKVRYSVVRDGLSRGAASWQPMGFNKKWGPYPVTPPTPADLRLDLY